MVGRKGPERGKGEALGEGGCREACLWKSAGGGWGHSARAMCKTLSCFPSTEKEEKEGEEEGDTMTA